jgi:MFS family permease
MSKSRAWKFIVLLGFVSLFADMTYEGGRSITGPFLALLGASAAATGVVAGLGELAGYGLRVLFGYLSDRTRSYWALTILGYAVNLVAIPCLALAGHWPAAAGLMVVERLGKAVRSPAKDVLLSHAASALGRGKGFALHEAMDQVGALTGPLIVAAVLAARGEYRTGFAVLAFPALLALAVLAAARFLFPTPQDLEPARRGPAPEGPYPKAYWTYLAFVAVSVAGYAHFQLIAYHWKARALVPDPQIPVLFALAMGVDALAALAVGRWYDRRGWPALLAVPLFSLPVAPLAFSNSYAAAAAAAVLWGAAMGAHETVMRAAVADLVPSARRGTAYGLFNGLYGVAWFLGSAAMGALYAVSIPALVALSVLLELASLPVLWALARKSPPGAD